MIPVSKLYNPVKACLHEDYKALDLKKHKDCGLPGLSGFAAVFMLISIFICCSLEFFFWIPQAVPEDLSFLMHF